MKPQNPKLKKDNRSEKLSQGLSEILGQEAPFKQETISNLGTDLLVELSPQTMYQSI